MKLTIVLEPQEEGGFTAYVPSLPGCVSQGETKEESIKNIKEAIELYLEADTNELVEFTGEKIIVTV
ncbi:type II toxin-antitoxin system HicB family antitoxin [Candidatus Woesearchaeota archaeon]|nr:type II toxin-antitoxin system HicB family antitoxin [Candidatus Woesearchaeota archaeon]